MDDSPLQQLPPELRTDIYRLVLTQPQTIRITPNCIKAPQPPASERGAYVFRCNYHPDRGPLQARITKHATALVQTCKAIYDEAASLPFTCNVFEIHEGHQFCPCRSSQSLDDRVATIFTNFANAISPRSLADIKQIQVRVDWIKSISHENRHLLPQYDQLMMWGVTAAGLRGQLEKISLGVSRTPARGLPIVVKGYVYSNHALPRMPAELREQRIRDFDIPLSAPAASLHAIATTIEQEEPVPGCIGIEAAQAEIRYHASFLRYVAERIQDLDVPHADGAAPVALESHKLGMSDLRKPPGGRALHRGVVVNGLVVWIPVEPDSVSSQAGAG
ncbi:hypothetical protein LTR53_011869 [Teratosphaeriaceae sp. CCFEE 6253]|nr:hypothetical protein LTR53_011869 [Teratosphaeriaceae sp. CCFEE 6253]